MDGLKDLMSSKMPTEPAAFGALKKYVADNYQTKASVMLLNNTYVLSVTSASLASNLQGESAAIKETCKLDKPLRIRISY